ncbi:MAG: hypothetical protein NC182_01615 [Prevotella sp.]|nr:hypothetical protein [Staphylococcus sp.]MCM1349880.1 hypothetical protein [Prevotella sp.]
MSKIYYLNDKKEWVEIPKESEDRKITQTFPQTYTLGIDQAQNCAEFSFFAPTDFHIPVDTAIKTENGDKINYWIVKNSKSSKMAHPNIWTQESENINTLTLIEPTEILRGFKIESNALAENSYTLFEIIRRLFDIANFDAEILIPNIEYNNPKLTFVSTTTYLTMYEIARTIDCQPYLDFNEESKKWVLKFKRLDGLNGIEYNVSVFDNPVDLRDETGEGLAKNVYCEVKNLRLNSNILEPYENGKKPATTDNTFEINKENIGLKMNNSITSLKKIYLYGYFYQKEPLEIDYNIPWIFEDNTDIIYYRSYRSGEFLKQTKRIRIIKSEEYENLTIEEKENKNIIYIYYNNNLIYLNQLDKLFDRILNNDGEIRLAKSVQLDDDNSFNILRGYFGDYGYKINLKNVLYKAYYRGIITKSIPLISSNNSKYDDIAYFNQNAQQVDPDRISRVLQTYIDNMQSASLMKSGTTDSWDKIPMPGSIIKDGQKRYVLNSITVQENAHYLVIDAQLTEERARRREYIEANTDLQINSIPNEDLVEKIKLDYAKIGFSMIDNRALVNNASINIENLIDLNSKLTYRIANDFNAGTEQYLLYGDPIISRVGTSIIFNEQAESNVIWDEYVDNQGNVIPRNYTDRKGKINEAFVRLMKDDLSVANYVIREYPAKDPYEIFSFTFQVNYRGIGNTIVREDYVEYLLNGAENPTYSIRLFDTNIGRYDALPSEYKAEIASVRVSNYDSNTQSISVDFESVDAEYKSIVLLLNDKAIMIKNYYEMQNILSSFKIYVSSEDGTPMRDGVVGINPYEESK